MTDEQTEVTEEPTGEEPGGAEESNATEGAAPQATTQGDLTPGADEHGVDTTPPLAEGDPQGDPHEPMVHEPGEPNERGQGGGDGTVWNG